MKFYLLIASIMLSFAIQAQSSIEKKINNDWLYLEQPVSAPEEVINKNGWIKTSLPHTWNATDVMDASPGYRRSISWYRKDLTFDELDSKSDYILYFEGSNITTHVYVNNQLAGQHIGGYIGFEINATPYLQSGKNTLLVKVDNGYNRDIIPSQKSDFFIYGGITRDVWLKTLPKTRIKSLLVSTPRVSETEATTNIDLVLTQPPKTKARIAVRLLDGKQNPVFEKKYKLKDELQKSLSFTLRNPMLWHVNSPHLYTLEVTLEENKEPVFQQKESIGYRWYEFKEHGPFYLNGKRLLLRGTHRHEEIAGYGAAMPDSLHRRDMEAIKALGANFVRLAHYPQDPEIYRACDELGILVWDELPWCRGGIGEETWQINTKNMLQEMILQNYNHPSIILWSLGNEIYWLPDFENGSDTARINTFLSELNTQAHELDPYRKTAIRKYYEGADVVDVFSPSIWSGWYSGSYKNYENTINKAMETYPRFLHMEYGGSSHVGRHNASPITGDGFQNPGAWEELVNQVEAVNVAKNGDWSENYMVDLFDWYLSITETHPDLTGNAQWAFRDFGTPLRPENAIPYVNQKGLVDREGNPKDAYYVFKSYWSDEPFVYIESPTWTDRSGPRGKSQKICVYSSLEEVELSLNGLTLERKKKNIKRFPASGLLWNVLFMEGKNTLIAKGYKNDSLQAADTLKITYWHSPSGKPQELALTSKKLNNGNYLVTATALDKNRRRCTDFEDRVYFHCPEGGELKRFMGTPTGSDIIELANGQASIEVVPDKKAKKLVVTVLNQNFKGTFLEIETNADSN